MGAGGGGDYVANGDYVGGDFNGGGGGFDQQANGDVQQANGVNGGFDNGMGFQQENMVRACMNILRSMCVSFS